MCHHGDWRHIGDIAPSEDVADIDRMSKDFIDYTMKYNYLLPKGILVEAWKSYATKVITHL